MYRNPDFFPILFNTTVMAVCFLYGFGLLFCDRFKKVPGLLNILLLFAVYVMVFTPESSVFAPDRANYKMLFEQGISGKIDDVGFLGYTNVLKRFIGKDFYIYLLINATLYVWSYLALGKIVSPKKWEFLILVWFLNIGFLNYFVNTMRQGMALSLALCGCAFSFKGRKKMAAAFFIIGTLFHFSIALVFLCFYVSRIKINVKYFYLLWIVFFIIAYLDLASPISNLISALGYNKISEYSSVLSGSGFRYDFIIFSLYPLLAGTYYVTIKGYRAPIYLHLFKTYILLSAFWLPFIRIPFTDRIAFLSWGFIPFIIISPLLDRTFPASIRKRVRWTGGFLLFALMVKLFL